MYRMNNVQGTLAEWYTVFQVSGIIYIIGGFVYIGSFFLFLKKIINKEHSKEYTYYTEYYISTECTLYITEYSLHFSKIISSRGLSLATFLKNVYITTDRVLTIRIHRENIKQSQLKCLASYITNNKY